MSELLKDSTRNMDRFLLEAHIDSVDEGNRAAVLSLHSDNWLLFASAPGSTKNHQAWEGGYLDHIHQVNTYAIHLYEIMRSSGGFAALPACEHFTVEELLTVTTLHDIEKPFRAQVKDGRIIVDNRLKSKHDREIFKYDLLDCYGITLTPLQLNAMKFVEGVRDADYSPSERIMSPMAALAHTADLVSARVSYDLRSFA